MVAVTRPRVRRLRRLTWHAKSPLGPASAALTPRSQSGGRAALAFDHNLDPYGWPPMHEETGWGRGQKSITWVWGCVAPELGRPCGAAGRSLRRAIGVLASPRCSPSMCEGLRAGRCGRIPGIRWRVFMHVHVVLHVLAGPVVGVSEKRRTALASQRSARLRRRATRCVQPPTHDVHVQ